MRVEIKNGVPMIDLNTVRSIATRFGHKVETFLNVYMRAAFTFRPAYKKAHTQSEFVKHLGFIDDVDGDGDEDEDEDGNADGHGDGDDDEDADGDDADGDDDGDGDHDGDDGDWGSGADGDDNDGHGDDDGDEQDGDAAADHADGYDTDYTQSYGGDDEVYEVSKVKDARMDGHKVQLLLSWSGYTSGDDTWQDLDENLHTCQDAIRDYVHDPVKPLNKRSPEYAIIAKWLKDAPRMTTTKSD